MDPLVAEATTLPTAPQRLHNFDNVLGSYFGALNLSQWLGHFCLSLGKIQEKILLQRGSHNGKSAWDELSNIKKKEMVKDEPRNGYFDDDKKLY